MSVTRYGLTAFAFAAFVTGPGFEIHAWQDDSTVANAPIVTRGQTKLNLAGAWIVLDLGRGRHETGFPNEYRHRR